MVRLVFSAVFFKWSIIVSVNFRSHSRTAFFQFATKVGLSLSMTIGLICIFSLAGVLSLAAALDKTFW